MKDKAAEEQRAVVQSKEREVASFDPHRRLVGDEKQQFIAMFVKEGRSVDYPVPPLELIDESIALAAAWDRHEKTGAWKWHKGPAGPRPPTELDELLVWHVERAYRRLGDVRRLPVARAVALDLMCSVDAAHLCQLSALSLRALSVDLVLAHLESLGFGLSRELSASIARRATITLMDRATLRESGRVQA